MDKQESSSFIKLYKPVYQPQAVKKPSAFQLLRVSTEDGMMRLDFVVYADHNAPIIKPIRVDNNAYIRPMCSTLQFKLIKAVNIPVFPHNYYFKKEEKCRYFTLYFEPLPAGTLIFDFIQADGLGDLDSFAGITLFHTEGRFEYSLN